MSTLTSTAHAAEVAAGDRFAFGANWTHFLAHLNRERIMEAERSLLTMLNVSSLEGKTVLDIGSGSGLFSLAARHLGATVHSFDYDPQSVACTTELRRRYCPDDPDWVVESGSVLDEAYVRSLGTFDLVYSWGVLHHTGSMHEAMRLASLPVAPGGTLFIAIYNDDGYMSELWHLVKQGYNALPHWLRMPYVVAVYAPFETVGFLKALARLRPMDYVRRWTEYQKQRGMSRWHDMVDWAGGLPYEFATPEGVESHYRRLGFTLVQPALVHRAGCNEYVFRRD